MWLVATVLDRAAQESGQSEVKSPLRHSFAE